MRHSPLRELNSGPAVHARYAKRKQVAALKARYSKAQGESPGKCMRRQPALKGRHSCCAAPSGMRVKLSIQALKARHSKAQGTSPGNGMRSNQP
jgi:hypothetical protein